MAAGFAPIVRDGDDLYVRSFRGTDGGCWRTARATHAGHVRSVGVDKDATFAEVPGPETRHNEHHMSLVDK
ncbi:DUF2255 family protein [Streptomyces sp. NPDC005859]|uniref:DUF2255 family protein n=1 Tax=Streptomyces sp. NPDC005859 TaxID=3157170 RepID=UPI0033D5C8F6